MSKKFYPKGRNSWNHLANWYSGWVGSSGSHYHQKIAFPTVLELLDLKLGEKIIDIGCGSGVFSKLVTRVKSEYVGIDISKGMIHQARKLNKSGEFYNIDILSDQTKKVFAKESFDSAVFILSIQDVSNLDEAIRKSSYLLKKGGKLVIFMKHPVFNIPRQSGWVEDKKRSLISRRIDRYYTSIHLPIIKYIGRKKVVNFHYHYPLGYYFEIFKKYEFNMFEFKELVDSVLDNTAHKEFPMFLAIGLTKD